MSSRVPFRKKKPLKRIESFDVQMERYMLQGKYYEVKQLQIADREHTAHLKLQRKFSRSTEWKNYVR